MPSAYLMHGRHLCGQAHWNWKVFTVNVPQRRVLRGTRKKEAGRAKETYIPSMIHNGFRALL